MFTDHVLREWGLLMSSMPAVLANSCRRMSRFERIAWGVWGVYNLVVLVVAFLKPQHDITHIYRAATQHWWAAEPLYEGGFHGFLYLPSSAILFTPFAYVDPLASATIWRALSAVLLSWAVVRLARLAAPPDLVPRLVAFTLLAIIPASGIDLVRGQMELAMFALMAFGMADAGEGRWNRAAFFLALAFALKPLALIACLLSFVLWPRLRLPLMLGILAVLVLPFVNPDPAYAWGQYGAAFEKLQVAAAPGKGRWNELSSLLARFGVLPARETMCALRAAAGLATLGLCLVSIRKYARERAAFLCLSFCVAYLLVFNPRTEDGSYVNLAVIAGLEAGRLWLVEGRRRLGGVLFGLVFFALATQAWGNWIYRPTDLWLKPFLCLLYMGVLAVLVLRGKAGGRIAG